MVELNGQIRAARADAEKAAEEAKAQVGMVWQHTLLFMSAAASVHWLLHLNFVWISSSSAHKFIHTSMHQWLTSSSPLPLQANLVRAKDKELERQAVKVAEAAAVLTRNGGCWLFLEKSSVDRLKARPLAVALHCPILCW